MGGGRDIIEKLARAAQRVPSRRRKRIVTPRNPGDGDSSQSLPVAPDRPLDLSGGAAAALTFED